jgi:hypothetical protein
VRADGQLKAALRKVGAPAILYVPASDEEERPFFMLMMAVESTRGLMTTGPRIPSSLDGWVL